MKTSQTYSVFQTLIKLHFITPKGLYRWVKSLLSEGTTLMALLRFSAQTYPHQTALLPSDGASLFYSELYQRATQLAYLLQGHYELKAGQRVGLLCRNHSMAVLLLPALSRLGVHTHLLNTEMGGEKLDELLHKGGRYDLLILDENLREKSLPSSLSIAFVTIENVESLLTRNLVPQGKLPRIRRGGELTVLTGGSSGHYKAASRRPSATQFLPPLLALLRQIGIHRYRNVYIALPLYHGFGLATLITSLVMGKEILLTRHFDAEQALQAIHRHGIEVAPLVPVMLSRMLQKSSSAEQLASLRCIICGGDRLERKLIQETHEKLGKVVYNLYGTSEAGFFLLATPDDLERYTETTLGRPIRGVHCRLEQVSADGVGVLWVRSGWAMQGRDKQWQATGDLMRCNQEGYYFYQGRADQMIVSGGENIYPEVVERTIAAHPEVFTAKVFPIPHPSFGQVLAAHVECCNKEYPLSEEALRAWLRPRLARAEMPHRITFGSVQLLETGKRKSGEIPLK